MNQKDLVKGAIAIFLGTLIALVDYRIVKAAFHEVVADRNMWKVVESKLEKSGITGDPISFFSDDNPPRGGENDKKNKKI